MKRSVISVLGLVVLLGFTVQADAGRKSNVRFLDDVKIFIEFNATDDDAGVQVFLDGVAWKRLTIFDPNCKRVLSIRAKGGLAEIGLTELMFEGAEPDPDTVFEVMPEGMYYFIGTTVGGCPIVGRARLSHELLDPAEFTPEDGDEVDPGGFTIEWEADEDAEAYQVIVQGEDSDVEMEVTLEGDADSFDVPSQLLAPGEEYKIEVLAIGENGNKIITEHIVETEED